MNINDVNIIVNTDEVIIEKGSDRVIVPRAVYDATKSAEKNPEFREAMNRTFEAIGEDKGVTGLAIVDSMDAPPPSVVIPRERIYAIAITTRTDPDQRVIVENADLHIVKAILEPGKRKWEFNWRGFRVNAAIRDDSFHTKFGEHEITIAPGDQLRVRLSIKQQRDPHSGVYTNISYEVIEVFEHIPGLKQSTFGDTTDE